MSRLKLWCPRITCATAHRLHVAGQQRHGQRATTRAFVLEPRGVAGGLHRRHQSRNPPPPPHPGPRCHCHALNAPHPRQRHLALPPWCSGPPAPPPPPAPAPWARWRGRRRRGSDAWRSMTPHWQRAGRAHRAWPHSRSDREQHDVVAHQSWIRRKVSAAAAAVTVPIPTDRRHSDLLGALAATRGGCSSL